MATVYLAHDVRNARDVALKVLHPELRPLVGAERFLAEIRVTANLRHPHILPLFDSGDDEGHLFYVMPYVAGGSLRDLLTRDGPLPVPQALRIAEQVADALAEAHAHGIVHRDVKPENVLLTDGGAHAYVSDFGIALSLNRETPDRATVPGFVIGTPLYMSPEHARGDRNLDGRSDVYSLGCVLHEMLTGARPSMASDAPTDAAQPLALRIFAARSRATSGPRQRTLRDFAPGPVARVVARAIASAPVDRYQSAGEFARALHDVAMAEGAAAARARHFPAGAASRYSRRLPLVIALSALVGLALLFRPAMVGPNVRHSVADRPAIAVFPLRTVGAPALNGGNCGRLLLDALARWDNIEFVDEMRVADALRASGSRELTLEGARDVARRLGVAQFIWGEASEYLGDTRVTAKLYAVRGAQGSTVPVRGLVPAGRTGDVAATFRALADSLLTGLAGAGSRIGTDVGTHDFRALKLYAEGYEALHRWDMTASERLFREALAVDPTFAQASLALAESIAWSGRYPPSGWRDPASRAAADSGRLGARDGALASALLALAERREGDACDTYRRLAARASRDFAVQFGLGECLSRDGLVVRDPSSPTRWRFRGSLAQSIAAYTRALELVPSYFEAARGMAFAALTDRIFFVGESEFRLGFVVARDTTWMGAFPSLVGDSVTFFPVEQDQLFRRGAPASHLAAVAHSREALRRITERWTTVYPRSANAQLHLAEVLETIGNLDVRNSGAPSALRAVDSARTLVASGEADGEQVGIRSAALKARLLLKLRRFDDARLIADTALADSLRVATSARDGRELEILAALAALTGRARLVASLLERAVVESRSELFWTPQGDVQRLPAPVLRAGATFAAYAALASPLDSVRATRIRAVGAINKWVPLPSRSNARALMIDRSSAFAQPALGHDALGAVRASGSDQILIWHDLARGDTSGVRRHLKRAVPLPSVGAPSVPRAPEWLLQEALLALAVRDSTTARAALTELLASVVEQQARLTEEVSAAAALPRALVLFAQLGGPESHSAAVAATALWLEADPELRSIVRTLPRGVH